MIDRVSVHSGRAKVARKQRAAVHIEELEAEDSFDAQAPNQQRWLLTTCIAGIAGSLIVGSALLGIFGQNAASTGAYASVQPNDVKSSGTLKTDMGGDVLRQAALQPFKSVSVAYRPDKETDISIIPRRSLYGNNLYPEISATSLPYGDGKTVVLDGEFDVTNIDSQNITTITKTPPPEPVDEAIILGQSRSLIEEITDRGVTKEAAQALVQALSGVFPNQQMAPGTRFELTLDKQQDFYGRDVIFPVQLTFKPGPARDHHRRSRRRRHVHSAHRWRKRRHAVALCSSRSLPHQGARRVEPLRHRQGQQGSRLHYLRVDPRLRL